MLKGRNRDFAPGMQFATLIVLLIAATLIGGCLTDEETTSPPTDEGPDEGEQPDGNTTDRIVQEASTAWLTGIGHCAGSGPSNIDTTDGVNHGIINLDGESLGNAFNATIESEIAPESWAILFWAFPNEVVDSFESGGDTIEGTVPEEPSMAVVHACAGLDHKVDFTVTAREGLD